MLAIQNIISNDFSEENFNTEINDDGQVEVQFEDFVSNQHQSCRKSFDTIVEEAESNESSILHCNIIGQDCVNRGSSRRNSRTPKIEIKTNSYNLSSAQYFTPKIAALNPLSIHNSQKLVKNLPSSFSSFTTQQICAPIYPNLKFKKKLFETTIMYNNSIYWEWLNYYSNEFKVNSEKIFDPNYRIKRRRKDSEFISRQWSKNNGLSSLYLSKSFNYESIKPDNNEQQIDFYSRIFQTEDADTIKNSKHELELELDDDYDNMSIPFEYSMPNKDLKKILKETQESFSLQFNDKTTSKKSINIEYLNQPLRQHLISNKENYNPSNVDTKRITLSSRDDITVFKARPTEETNWNLSNTQISLDVINKPKQLVSSPRYNFEVPSNSNISNTLISQMQNQIKELTLKN